VALSGICAGILISFLGLVMVLTPVADVVREDGHRVGEKVDGLGFREHFVPVAIFISVFHSAMEEYYWRWFVYGRARSYLGPALANLFSSLGFMAHHVVVINAFLPDDYFWSATVPLSLCVAFGGAIWAALYERKGSLYGAWLSHALVDVSIMICGYDMAFVDGS
jgi:membrane protease YdiL (CAAX protease family)